jgi:DNA-binding protein H-NS
MTDLSNYSLAQLRDLQAQVADQINKRQKDEVAEIQRKIMDLAKSVGMTVEQIMQGAQAKKPAKTVAVRYQHPEQPEKQWTGRGRKPHWIQEYLDASGKPLELLLIA